MSTTVLPRYQQYFDPMGHYAAFTFLNSTTVLSTWDKVSTFSPVSLPIGVIRRAVSRRSLSLKFDRILWMTWKGALFSDVLTMEPIFGIPR